jgi:hypothetical protein
MALVRAHSTRISLAQYAAGRASVPILVSSTDRPVRPTDLRSVGCADARTAAPGHLRTGHSVFRGIAVSMRRPVSVDDLMCDEMLSATSRSLDDNFWRRISIGFCSTVVVPVVG